MKYICPGYIRACFQIRNERMVDYSARGHRGVQWRERWHQKHHILCYPAGRDCSRSRSGPGTSWISTHTPHAGRDAKAKAWVTPLGTFQLTRPMRGVTASAGRNIQQKAFQLTRPMRGVTAAAELAEKLYNISTHTPHAGRDDVPEGFYRDTVISTHTPHAGRDADLNGNADIIDISTHTPHAGRDVAHSRIAHTPTFQLTRPMRGVTVI